MTRESDPMGDIGTGCFATGHTPPGDAPQQLGARPDRTTPGDVLVWTYEDQWGLVESAVACIEELKDSYRYARLAGVCTDTV